MHIPRPALWPPYALPLCTMLLLGLPLSLAAQQEQPLSADRPGFGTGTAAVGAFQAEAGYTYSDPFPGEQQSIGQLLLRFPLAPQVELRLAPNSYVVRDIPIGTQTGFEDLGVGFKWNFAAGAEQFDLLRPAASLVVTTTLPTGDDEFGAESLQPQALLALGWALPAGFGLGGDINFTSLDAGDERSTQIAGGATLAYAFGVQTGAFVELYTFAPEDSPDATYFDGGITYLLSPDLQLDVNGGVGITDAADDFFVGFGAAVRW